MIQTQITMHYNSSYYKSNMAAFYIVVIFLFFDGIRSNVIYREYLTLIREAALFFLIYRVINLQPHKINLPYSLRFFILDYTFVAIFSFLQLGDGPISTNFIVKPYEFVATIYVFYNFEKLTNRTYTKLVKYILYTSIVFCVVDVMLYFIPLPIWNRESFWWGRVSCGYPTMDVVTLSYTLILLIYYPYSTITGFAKIVSIVINIVCLILNFSGTGMVLLVIIISVSLLLNIKNQNKKIIWVVLGLFVTGASSSLVYFRSNFGEAYENGTMLIQNKYDIIMGNNMSKYAHNTIELRETRFEHVKQRQNTLMQSYVGMGLNNMSMDRETLRRNPKAYSMENQYLNLILSNGYIGLCLYIFIMMELLYITVKMKIGFNLKVMLLLSLIIWALNSYTLLTLMLFSNSVYLAFYIAAILRLKKGKQI